MLGIAYEELPPKEVENIFVTASHSLLVRDLLQVAGDGEKLSIASPLGEYLDATGSPEATLFYQRVDTALQTSYTGHLHRKGSSYISYQSLDGIVHTFKEVGSPEGLAEEGLSLLGLRIKVDTENDGPLADLPARLVNDLAGLTSEQAAESRDALVSGGFTTEQAERFLEDAQHAASIYSVMKLEEGKAQELRADRGLIVIESEGAQWLLYPDGQGNNFTVSKLSPSLFRTQIQELDF